jgi:hypothetical protein
LEAHKPAASPNSLAATVAPRTPTLAPARSSASSKNRPSAFSRRKHRHRRPRRPISRCSSSCFPQQLYPSRRYPRNSLDDPHTLLDGFRARPMNSLTVISRARTPNLDCPRSRPRCSSMVRSRSRFRRWGPSRARFLRRPPRLTRGSAQAQAARRPISGACRTM